MPGLEGYDVHRGINTLLAHQLVEKSKQPEIVSATPKDYESRFVDIGSIDRWLNEGRQIYPLVEAVEGDLAGIIWHGPKVFPVQGLFREGGEPNDTFGIRLYDGYRSRGLGIPFMKHCLADYIASVAESDRAAEFRGIWLSTLTTRPTARPLFERFGYSEVSRNNDEIIMVLPPYKIREILGRL